MENYTKQILQRNNIDSGLNVFQAGRFHVLKDQVFTIGPNKDDNAVMIEMYIPLNKVIKYSGGGMYGFNANIPVNHTLLYLMMADCKDEDDGATPTPAKTVNNHVHFYAQTRVRYVDN